MIRLRSAEVIPSRIAFSERFEVMCPGFAEARLLLERNLGRSGDGRATWPRAGAYVISGRLRQPAGDVHALWATPVFRVPPMWREAGSEPALHL